MNGIKNYFSSRESPDQLTTFALLYMVSTVHELGDPWWSWGGQRTPILLQGLILVVIVMIALNINPATLLLFAAISATFYLVTAFPEFGNHVTLLNYCNFVILVSLPVLMLLGRPAYDNNAIFASIKPVMRLMLITGLFLAGFHKFNTDFSIGIPCL